MIKNLYIFRHGETDYNIARRMQSVLDIPLNQNGIHQAEELAKKLANVNLGCIYTSKLGRAIETANIVAKPNNTPVIVDNRLHEWDLGVFKGKILNVIKAPKYTPIDLTKDTVSIPRLLLIDNDFVPENGESFNTCINRVSDALNYIVKNTDSENIGIATHGGVIRAILTRYTNYANGGMPNADYMILQWDGEKFRLLDKPKWLKKKHPIVLVKDFISNIFRGR